ncbi:MAG: hypothetical protein IT376_16490 [Polyangiaceae bacterium]|nr:hypothetical protein [Polyangiaceae bacterium]
MVEVSRVEPALRARAAGQTTPRRAYITLPGSTRASDQLRIQSSDQLPQHEPSTNPARTQHEPSSAVRASGRALIDVKIGRRGLA